MDNIEALRLASLFVVIIWSMAAAAIVPILWRARRHPLLMMLLTLCGLRVLEAVMFVDASFAYGNDLPARPFMSIIGMRIVSIVAAGVMFGTIYLVATRRWR